MAHSLLRLTQSLHNVPHLITEPYLRGVVSILEDRNNGKIELAVGGTGREREPIYNPDTAVGILNIDGPLTYLEYEPLCGEPPTSYQGLKEDMQSIAEVGAKIVVMDFCSPGGEAYQCFETARAIRAIADEHGIQLIAYVDGLAASAGYALAAIADEIIVNPQAEVGSIGVVVKLRNVNKALKEMGIEDTYIHAGKSKIPFDQSGGFTEGFLEDIQEKVDVLYEEFISHVAEARGISKESVKNTEAKTFLPAKAIELGLADKTMTLDEFYTYLGDKVEAETRENMPLPKKLKLFNSKTEDKPQMVDTAELSTQLSTLETKFAEFKTNSELAVSAAQAEATRLSAELADKATKLEEALGQINAAKEAAAQAKLTARKEKIADAVAEDKVEALTAAFASMDDAGFETALEAVRTKTKTEAATPDFQEQGGAGGGELLSKTRAQEMNDTLTAKLQAKHNIK